MSRLPLDNLDPEPALPLEGVEREPVYHAPWDAGFPDRLKWARKRLYRNVDIAAVETGIPARTWERLETGAAEPRGGTFKLICEKLKVSPVWLLWGIEPVDLPAEALDQARKRRR